MLLQLDDRNRNRTDGQIQYITENTNDSYIDFRM